jgi:hypothetical protein
VESVHEPGVGIAVPRDGAPRPDRRLEALNYRSFVLTQYRCQALAIAFANVTDKTGWAALRAAGSLANAMAHAALAAETSTPTPSDTTAGTSPASAPAKPIPIPERNPERKDLRQKAEDFIAKHPGYYGGFSIKCSLESTTTETEATTCIRG